MTALGTCGLCGAQRESEVAHVCATGFWADRQAPHDPVRRPRHYTQHPSGVECIQVTEHLNFCLGNAVKYIWRAGEKDGTDDVEDLEKAKWYVEREIQRRRAERSRRGGDPVQGDTSAAVRDVSERGCL